jgi:AraC-like DNA-binding protein
MDNLILDSKELRIKAFQELGIHRIKAACFQHRQVHKNTQLTFMLEGHLVWEAQGGRKIELRGGEYCLTCPGDNFVIPHNVLAPCYLMWILLNPFAENTGEYSLLSQHELEDMLGILTQNKDFKAKITESMQFYLNEISKIADVSSKKEISPLGMHKIRLSLMGILFESVKAANERVSTHLPSSAFSRDVKQLVLDYPSRFLSVAEIASHFNLSPSLFCKKFKKETGLTLADFVRRIKLEESLKPVRNSSKSITEIAYSLGFSSSQYYATLFKKYFGKTPRQFRNEKL